jgi:hypothetical protein
MIGAKEPAMLVRVQQFVSVPARAVSREQHEDGHVEDCAASVEERRHQVVHCDDDC